MKCDSCKKERTFLYFIGKTNICHKCIARQTVFRRVKHTNDTFLRKAMRAFDIKSFDELKAVTEEQLEALEEGKLKNKRGQTFKYKENKQGNKGAGKKTYMEDQEEKDIN